jgi:hypothetical protein
MALMTTYFLPIRISSLTTPNVSLEEVKASCEPVTTPPASSAMTIPAQTSQGLQYGTYKLFDWVKMKWTIPAPNLPSRR